MPRTRINFDVVKRIGLQFPDVQESTVYRSPALKLRRDLMTCIAIHKSAELNSIVIQVGFDKRAELIAADPKTYYLTDHYVNYPVVLARMSRLDLEGLRNLLAMSWLFVSEGTLGGKPPARNKKRSRARNR